MNQYETSVYSITEKARSERLFMHYALLLACLFTATGAALIVLGIGDHLDIVVKGTGSLEARFVNASPGFGMAVLGLLMLGWAKPRRLKLKAKHNTSESESDTPESDVKLEAFEESMRELIFEIEARTRRVDQQRHERLIAEFRRLLLSPPGEEIRGPEDSRAKDAESGELLKQAPKVRQSVTELDVKYSRNDKVDHSGKLPPFDPNQSDEEKFRTLMEWGKRNAGIESPPKVEKAKPPTASDSGEVDVLYQGPAKRD